MTCLCTGACRVPPYTCGGAVPSLYREPDISVAPWTLPQYPIPSQIDAMQSIISNLMNMNDSLQKQLVNLYNEIRELREENRRLRSQDHETR